MRSSEEENAPEEKKDSLVNILVMDVVLLQECRTTVNQRDKTCVSWCCGFVVSAVLLAGGCDSGLRFFWR